MEDLAYYTSQVPDMFSQDETIEPEHLLERGHLSYMCDSIINTIGTPECKQNIKLFLDEIEKDSTEESLEQYYKYVFNKLVEVYKMYVLDVFVDGKRDVKDYNKEVRILLEFFELNYHDFVVKVIGQNENVVQNSLKFYEDLINDFPSIRIRLDEQVKSLSGFPVLFFRNAAKNDICDTLFKLVCKDPNSILLKIMLIKEEHKNVDD